MFIRINPYLCHLLTRYQSTIFPNHKSCVRKKGVPTRHPSFLKMERENSRIRIWFDNADAGIVCKGKEPFALEIAGEDMKFVPAKGKIDKKTNTLVVTSTTVKHPVAVRYSFSNDAVGNLFCSNGLPVLPFRTDNEVIEIF